MMNFCRLVSVTYPLNFEASGGGDGNGGGGDDAAGMEGGTGGLSWPGLHQHQLALFIPHQQRALGEGDWVLPHSQPQPRKDQTGMR